ncbi:MAG: hypothetical protein WCR27_05135 [Eubacteriales bacterium]
MGTIVKATSYQLTLFRSQSWICLAIIVLNILISVTVSYLFPSSGISAGSSDMIAVIWIFILGLLSFAPSFKFMLANAVSRKSLFWANIFSMVILSVAWAVAMTLVISFINRMNLKMIVVYPLIYKGSSTMGTVVWFSGMFFLLIVLGWFITMAYYRSNKLMIFVISLAPFVIAGLFTIINQMTGGKLFDFMINFIVTAMGFSGSIPNPYIGSFSMLVITVILCVLNYLLIRKTQIKE